MDKHRSALQRAPLIRWAWLAAAALLLAACASGPTRQPPEPPADGAIAVEGFERFASRGEADTAVFEFTNTGDRALEWTLAVEPDPDGDNPREGAWFDADPESGTLAAGESVDVTLTMRSGLPEGAYRADLRVEYDGGPTRFEVTGVVGEGVDVQVVPSSLALAPGGTGTVALRDESSTEITFLEERIETPEGVTARLLWDEATATSVPLEVSVAASLEEGEYTIGIPALDAGTSEAVGYAALDLTVVADDAGDARATGVVTTPNIEIPLTGAPHSPPSGVRASAPARDGAPDFVPGELLVRWADDGALQAQAADAPLEVAGLALRPLEARGPERAQRVALPEGADVLEAAARVAAAPGVLWAEPNWLFHRAAIPNDPQLDRQWHLPVAGVPYGWDVRAGLRSSVTLAVLDSAFDLDHEDLAEAFLPGYDFCASEGCATVDADPGVKDAFFDTHATHVAGLAAATGGNGVGVAGVARTGGPRLVPVKVFPDDPLGSASAQAIADAIRWAAGLSGTRAGRSNANPADVITLSLGSTGDSTAVREAVRAARDAGALVVAAVGNSGTDRIEYPAAYEGVLGVGAVNSELRRSCFSNTSNVDLVAPGGDGFLCEAPRDEALWSTFPDDDYGYDAGTSMATPIVAAAAAIVWSQNPDWSAEQVAQRLMDTAYLPSGSGPGMGAGVVRLDAALGLPGPGDIATVTAQGRSATATLDPYGSSTPWTLTGLEAGSTTFTAVAEGLTRERSGTDTAVLEEGATESGIDIRLE